MSVEVTFARNRCLAAALLLTALLGLSLWGARAASAETVSFATPGCTSWSVPVGSDFQVQATGAQGAPGGSYVYPIEPAEVLNSGGPGGRGDLVTAALSELAPGSQLVICVDVGGGAGGGSEGETRCTETRGFPGCFLGGAGGGASGVSVGGDFSQALLVAAGGGGGGGLSPWGFGAPAYGGGAAGEPGAGGPRQLEGPYEVYDNYFGYAGGGASVAQAGSAGNAGGDGTEGAEGSAFSAAGPAVGGAGGFGEDKGSCDTSPCEGGGGGGGGGGYYSGGGGGGGGIDGGGGGGGGSLVPPGGSVTPAAEAAQPQVQISYTPGPATVTEGTSEVAQTAATLNAKVNPEGQAVDECYFEYGPTEGYGSIAPCTTPPGSGLGSVAVSAPVGELAANTLYHFRIVATNTGGTSFGDDESFETLPDAPEVDGVSPDAGLESGGTQVTITGGSFAEATAVKFGSIAASFTIDSPTTITATAPAQAQSTVRVTVSNHGGTSALGGADQFTYVAPGHGPNIKSLSSRTGPASGGSTLTITGSGFVGVTQVAFGSTPAAAFTVNSPTSITVETPAETTGTVEVSVTTPDGETGVTSKDRYKFGNPTITSISPATGSHAGGTVVTVSGSGFAFGSATTFSFGKLPGIAVDCTSTTSCTVTSPAASKAGAVKVVAVVAGKRSKPSSAPPFNYT